MRFDGVRDFLIKRKKLVSAIVFVVLALAFIGSIFGAVFGGGEFIDKQESPRVKGVLRINKGIYNTQYILGDPFVFNKADSDLTLLAKDPSIENIVKIDKLPATEYGFMVNGKGSLIDDPASIIISADVKTIDVVSKKYPDLRYTLDITTVKGIDESLLCDNLTLEAETTDLYQDGTLLSEDDKKTMPDVNKPFLSSESPVEGADCSGGACLRNFQKRNMTIKFTVVSSQNCEVSLEVLLCKRTKAGMFGDWFVFSLNGEPQSILDNASVPAGSGYFEPYTLPAVTIGLKRGKNVLTFESGSAVGKTSPANFDAIRIVSAQSNIGLENAIIY